MEGDANYHCIHEIITFYKDLHEYHSRIWSFLDKKFINENNISVFVYV